MNALDAHIRRREVDVHLQLDPPGPGRGPVTVLFGPSGAGKTTVLRVLAGLEPSDAGHVRFDGELWDDGRRRVVPTRRRRVGMLFQDHALFPHRDVMGNVTHGLRGVPRRERPDRATWALRLAGAAGLEDSRVATLSGGESQRVALARALAPRPRLLLLDEPLSALDTPTRLRLRSDLRAALLESGGPAVLVTHDRDEALQLADRVVVLLDGQVRQVGRPDVVFDRPADPEVAAVVGVETAAPGRVLAHMDGLVEVAVGGAVLSAATDAPFAPGDEVVVCVRAHDVALEPASGHGRSSHRSRLPARVLALRPEGGLVRVDLDAGIGLTALVTRPAAEELDLAPGVAVTALVKAPAVHLVPRPPGQPDPPGEVPRSAP